MKKSTWHLTSVILTVVCGDGIIKKLAEKKLAEQPPKRVCGGKIILNLLHNNGAALGVLSREPRLLLVVNSALVGAAAGGLLASDEQQIGKAARMGLALAVGGGLSNLIDRLQRGYVTDYFSLDLGERFEKLKKVVFNVSDFCVFAGCILWCFQHRSKSRP